LTTRHADQAGKTGEDWLTESRVYFPFDPTGQEYFFMKFGAGV
jgi:hypothetical protein